MIHQTPCARLNFIFSMFLFGKENRKQVKILKLKTSHCHFFLASPTSLKARAYLLGYLVRIPCCFNYSSRSLFSFSWDFIQVLIWSASANVSLNTFALITDLFVYIHLWLLTLLFELYTNEAREAIRTNSLPPPHSLQPIPSRARLALCSLPT